MKVILVKDCGHCPYRYSDLSEWKDGKGYRDYCNQTEREVEDRRKIPEWCPLSEMY